MIFIYLLSGLFLGWSLGANDTGNIFGAAVETRMLKYKTAALIASIFIFLGAVFEGSGPSGTLGRLGSVDALGGAFTVALAAALTITAIVRTGIPVSTSQTIVGAIIGWNYFSGRLTDFQNLLTIVSSWVIAFVLSGIIAALLFYLISPVINKGKIHLLEQDVYVRLGLIIIGAFGAFSLGANNIANVVGVFVPVTPFKDINLGSFTLSGIQQLYILGAISIIVGIYTYSHKVMRTVGKDIFHLSPVTALIAVTAEAIVLFIFASRGLQNLLLSIGLPPIPLVPVSSTQVIVGAVVGIGLVKGGKNIRYNILGKVSLAWIAAPVIAFFFAFIALFIVQNVFEQTVCQKTIYTFNRTTISQIEKEGLDVNHLSSVNGHKFYRELEVYKELKAEKYFMRSEILKIIRIAEVYPLKVDTNLLRDKGLVNRFSKEQWEALVKLEGREFKHKWQLKETLAKDPSWQKRKEITERDKLHNQDLEEQFNLLFRTFYFPPA
ncbi:MAG TPA: inorganic phosphate transporter [Candidatus Cloacimonas sp.]|nr:inorganic phosphate transporter [Candidatus Cloacimonas sp.]HPA24062.1 inorganic phosphate transporter [Candidatus Cloacimonas sp.]HQM03232.1 inorganic phosphate transporter [Candidatus Cloacimonas sp.]HQO46988.1 inorganic phosphate transporter [Candidatus Cloacimonas sp.]HQP32529.1 inorganic phosphate transporter [Candidatus Cloacimonas sp.]